MVRYKSLKDVSLDDDDDGDGDGVVNVSSVPSLYCTGMQQLLNQLISTLQLRLIIIIIIIINRSLMLEMVILTDSDHGDFSRLDSKRTILSAL